jgi:hypothetical protein
MPAVAGLAAFVACGVEEAEALPEAPSPSALEQTRRELWVDLGSNIGTPVTPRTGASRPAERPRVAGPSVTDPPPVADG